MVRMTKDAAGLFLILASLIWLAGCDEANSDLELGPATAGSAQVTAGVVAGAEGQATGAGETAGQINMMVPSNVSGTPMTGGRLGGGATVAQGGARGGSQSSGAGIIAGAVQRVGGEVAGDNGAAGSSTAGDAAGESNGGGQGIMFMAGRVTAGDIAGGHANGGMDTSAGAMSGGRDVSGGLVAGGAPMGGDAIGGQLAGGTMMGGASACVSEVEGGEDIGAQAIDFSFPAPEQTIVKTLLDDGRFTHLLRMIQVAGQVVVSDLSNRPMTLLAATDDALEIHYTDEELRLIKSRSSESQAFLKRHMVRGHRDFNYLSKQRRLSTVAGRFLTVANNGAATRIQSVDFQDQGIHAFNGWVHPIDGVIELPSIDEPPACDDPEIIEADAQTVGGVNEDDDWAEYQFTADSAGVYCFDTRGSATDTAIRVLDNCGVGGLPERNNDNPTLSLLVNGTVEEREYPGVFAAARIEWTLDAEETVSIGVRAANLPGGLPGSGDFIVTAYAGPCLPITLKDYLDADGNYSVFLDLVKRFELESLLTGDGTHTVFAPSNEAFRAFESEAEGELAARAQDGQEMWALLRYHFIDSALLDSDLVEQRLVATQTGINLEAVVRVNQVYVNGASIEGPNRITDNGVIHEVDGLLSPPPSCNPDGCSEDAECVDCVCLPKPPPGTVMDELRRKPEHSIFVGLVDYVDEQVEAGVATVLADTGVFAPQGITAFVPTNDGFGGIDLDALRNDPEGLARTIRFHIARERYSGEDLQLQMSVASFIDEALPIQQTLEGTRVADVPILLTDVDASNGLIHVVQRLLVAPPLIDACSEAVAIEEAAPQRCAAVDPNRWCYFGTTVDAGSVHEARCVEAEGPERVFRFRTSTAGRYCIHTLDSPNLDGEDYPLDTVLHVRESSCASPRNAVVGMCNDNCDGANGGGCGAQDAQPNLSSLTVELEAETDYFIFVDTYILDPLAPAPRGNFTLTIEPGQGCGEVPPSKTLRELIAERPELSDFNNELNRLYGEEVGFPGGAEWPGVGQHTVFAPTNSAFQQLDAARLQEMLNSDEWPGIVGYHLAAERLPTRIIEDQGAWFTLGPPNIPLLATSRGGELIIGGARIVVGEIQASDGILYTVDTLLLPPDVCMGDNDCGGDLVCGQAGVCVELPPMYTCENPFLIPTDGPNLFGQLEGDTSEQVSYEGASCAYGAEGPDHVYTLTGEGAFLGVDGAPVEVCLQTLGSDDFPGAGDTAMHVRRGSCAGEEIACVDDVQVDFAGQLRDQVSAQITLEVQAGETYYVFVDGSEEALKGPYVLSVLPGRCEAD